MVPRMISRKLAVVAAVATLAGCAPAERQVTWIPPQGITGRDVIRDKLVCRQNAGRDAVMEPPPPGSITLASALSDTWVYQAAKLNFVSCMQEAGYTQVAH
jgi:hypothetical protein